MVALARDLEGEGFLSVRFVMVALARDLEGEGFPSV